MSIVVYVKVSEGIVIAADSMAAIEGEIVGPNGKAQRGILKTFEHAKKVSHLANYPIGTLTWGLSQIGARTIESLIKEFETLPESEVKDYKVKDLADKLCDFIKKRYDALFTNKKEAKKKPGLGMIVCGFSKGQYFPEEYRMILPIETQPVRLRPDLPDGRPNFGANWYGLTDPIVRFYLGYDQRLPQIMKELSIEDGKIKQITKGFEYQVVFPGMPLQDAIDFASFLVELCIWRNRFVIGAPKVGGNIDVAVITHDKFEWVSRKEWKSIKRERG